MNEIELPEEFLSSFAEALSQNQAVHNGLAGFILGRGLKGDYELRLRGAHLVPKPKPVEIPASNEQTPNRAARRRASRVA